MLTDEQAQKAISKHKQPAYSYRVMKHGDEGLIELTLTMWGETISHMGSADEIEALLRSAADHIRERYLDGR
mgnify:CR=1 FL=1